MVKHLIFRECGDYTNGSQIVQTEDVVKRNARIDRLLQPRHRDLKLSLTFDLRHNLNAFLPAYRIEEALHSVLSRFGCRMRHDKQFRPFTLCQKIPPDDHARIVIIGSDRAVRECIIRKIGVHDNDPYSLLFRLSEHI